MPDRSDESTPKEEAGGSIGTEDPLWRQTVNELRQVESVVSELTGLPSRWNGEVELRDEPRYHGAKPLSCGIVLSVARQRVESWPNRARVRLGSMLPSSLFPWLIAWRW
jgi:hypothetical protein